uniref:Forkhead box J3 n=1 Tax=Salarias fasciatus TaxID=181472 RepID=A0A672IHV2_SALFA
MLKISESMRQAELNNWSLDPAQMADLCSSINQFFTATGVIPPQSASHPQPQPHGAMHPKPSHHNQHINTGNMYMDSRQSMSSLMGPPGYPHLPLMSNTAPAMTGDSSIALLAGQQPRLPDVEECMCRRYV